MRSYLATRLLGLLTVACGPEVEPCDSYSTRPYGLEFANDSGYDCAMIADGLRVVWEVAEEQGFADSVTMAEDRQDTILILTDGPFSCADLENAGGCANNRMVKVRTYGEVNPWPDTSWAHEWGHWVMANYTEVEDHHTSPIWAEFVREVNNRL